MKYQSKPVDYASKKSFLTKSKVLQPNLKKLKDKIKLDKEFIFFSISQ